MGAPVITVVIMMKHRLQVDDCRINVLRTCAGGRCYIFQALIIPLLVNDLLKHSP